LVVSGWLFDAYTLGDKIVIWLKTESGQAVRLQDSWSHSIYVAADSRQALEKLAKNAAVQHYAQDCKFVSRYERVTDYKRSDVLKLTLRDSAKAIALANVIEDVDYDAYRLYNVDILPPQAYFYEHDLYPLAKCHVENCNGKLVWQFKDDLKETDYEVPDFKIAHLSISIHKEGSLPKFTDRLDGISIKIGNEVIEIRAQSEQDMLADLITTIAKIDPDFLFIGDGDEFVLPYLTKRAQANDMQLVLDREGLAVAQPSKAGVTYLSYGRVHYRPSTVMLYGRIHIDTHSSFILDHSALHGLYEIARICRLPFNTCARATIGRCLSSMQMYRAFKRNLLVPYKPVNVEKFKSFNELLRCDRGGLTFEPVIGVHENVAEFDFTSLYPSIMSKRNISGETVNCACCPNSKNIVKELGYHICYKHRGIVSETLELFLDKRAKYKQLKKITATDNPNYKIYDSRQDALKWLGVVSFGYLGHANSKFGLIDSHICVCAIDREVLLTARNVAESKGYDALHGIVDSLWLFRQGATSDEYARLKEPIEQATGYDLSFEGVYKWVAFLPSKQNEMIGVPNRYFGVFEDGKIKDRGIETRRHDTPPLFSQFQRKALQIMAQGDNVEQVKALMPQVRELFLKYKKQLQDGRVPLEDLAFTKMLSKGSDEYTVSTVETESIDQLSDEGKTMRAGQVLHYVITDYYRKNARKRSIPIEMINKNTTYDAKRYIELLAKVCDSITEPFGYKVLNQIEIVLQS
jgi:DNA polymerase-2